MIHLSTANLYGLCYRILTIGTGNGTARRNINLTLGFALLWSPIYKTRYWFTNCGLALDLGSCNGGNLRHKNQIRWSKSFTLMGKEIYSQQPSSAKFSNKIMKSSFFSECSLLTTKYLGYILTRIYSKMKTLKRNVTIFNSVNNKWIRHRSMCSCRGGNNSEKCSSNRSLTYFMLFVHYILFTRLHLTLILFLQIDG